MKQIWKLKNGATFEIEGEFPYKDNDIVITSSLNYNDINTRFRVYYGFWRRLFKLKPILKEI